MDLSRSGNRNFSHLRVMYFSPPILKGLAIYRYVMNWVPALGVKN